MKSKLTFDLDGHNNPVIFAYIETTDDVRDKIAVRFKEAFGYTGNLCHAYFLPAEGHSEIIIQSFSSEEKIVKEVVDSLCIAQKVELYKAIKKSLDYLVSVGTLTKEYENVNNLNVKKKLVK